MYEDNTPEFEALMRVSDMLYEAQCAERVAMLESRARVRAAFWPVRVAARALEAIPLPDMLDELEAVSR